MITRRILIIRAVLPAVLASSVLGQEVLFVDLAASGANNGSDWFNAFDELQAALVAADEGGVSEIRVARGVFRPDRGGADIGDRGNSFRLVSGVTIRGGYAGVRGAFPNARDLVAYESVLTGDLDLDDDSGGSNVENAYHVVEAIGVDRTAILDGFTIVAGNADGAAPDDGGGGVLIDAGSPTLRNCVVRGSSADGAGGGLSIKNGSPLLVNILIYDNAATVSGGGVQSESGSTALFVSCTIADNTSSLGGGIYNAAGSSVSIVNSIVWGNTGGAVTGPGDASVEYSDIEGGGGGGTNIDDDPDFASVATGDFHLLSGSPALDVGDNGAANLPPVDLDCRDRISNGTVDMGAYEFQDCNGNLVPDVTETDTDGDGVIDACDSCIQIPNPNQDVICRSGGADSDGDGVIDACEAPANVLYVRSGAQGLSDGTDWVNAYPDLQSAMAAAEASAGAVTEIHVARGTYAPQEGLTLPPVPVGDPDPERRATSFLLQSGMALRGGFSGFATPGPDTRNTFENLTILTGDDYGDDYTSENENRESSYQVVRGIARVTLSDPDPVPVDETAVLDGFTITGGNADTGENGDGAGLLNGVARAGEGEIPVGATPTIIDCTFSANFASGAGAGMYNEGACPTILNSAFLGNRCNSVGGGMFNRTHSNPLIINGMFSGNSAFEGAGAYNQTESVPAFTNCVFVGNEADAEGGGAFNRESNPIYANCTFTRNEGTAGGAMYNLNATPTVVNTILWDNPGGSLGGSSSPIVIFSDVDGGFVGGSGNINVDPMLVNVKGGNVRLSLSSPCIDAGKNGVVPQDALDLDGDEATTDPMPFDFDGNLRFIDILGALDIGEGTPPLVDMGPFEFALSGDVFNVTQGTNHTTIADAILLADDHDELEVQASQFTLEPSFDLRGKALTIRSTGKIDQPAGGSIRLADDAALATAPGESLTIAGELKTPVGASVDLVTQTLDVEAAGTLLVEAGSDIAASGAGMLSGTTTLNASGVVHFANSLTIEGVASLAIASSLRTGGTLDVTPSADLRAVSGALLFASGSVALSGPTSLELGATLTTDGDLYVESPGLYAGTDTRVFIGGNATITGLMDLELGSILSSDATLHIMTSGQLHAVGATLLAIDAVTLDGTSVLENRALLSTDAALSLTSTGALTATSSEVTAGSDLTLDGPADLSLGCTLAAGGTLAVTAQGSLSATDSTVFVVGDVGIAGSATLGAGSTLSTSGAIGVASSSEVLIGAGASVSAGTDITLDSDIRLAPNSTLSAGINLTNNAALRFFGASVVAGGTFTNNESVTGFGTIEADFANDTLATSLFQADTEVVGDYINGTEFGVCDDTEPAVEGNPCQGDEDCGVGLCITVGECDGSGTPCSSDADCGGATCLFHDECDANSAGELAGTPCAVDGDCRLGICLNATTTVQDGGVLIILGTLTNYGTMNGAVQPPPSAAKDEVTLAAATAEFGRQVFVQGSLVNSRSASVNLADDGTVIEFGGDFDTAIDDSSRFALSRAELRLNGPERPIQFLEVMSENIGPSAVGLRRHSRGHYPIGMLRVGPGSTVELMDAHDNDRLGQEVAEAIYARQLVVEPGSVLLTNGYTVYYVELTLEGAVDAFENLVQLVPAAEDLDQDFDVDLDDYAVFVGCLAGPDQSDSLGGCTEAQMEAVDLDNDNDVDLGNLGVFQAAFTDD